MKLTSNECDHNVCTTSGATSSVSLFHINSNNTSSNNNSHEVKNKFKLNVKRVAIHTPSDTSIVQDNDNCAIVREANSGSIQTHEHFCAPDSCSINNNTVKSASVESNNKKVVFSTDDKSMASTETNAPMRYGGGIVRISDLRARGETFLESGLNLRSMNKRSREECNPRDNKENNVLTNYAISQEQAFSSSNHHTLCNIKCTSTPPPQEYIKYAKHENNKQEINGSVDDGGTRDGLESATWTNWQDERPQQKATKNRKKSSLKRKRGGGRNVKYKRQSQVKIDNYADSDYTFSDGNDNSNYQWYTVKGRRRLVVNGKTYRGKAAHSLWGRLKKKATQTTRQSSSTLTSHTHKRGSNTQVITQPKIVKASEIYSHRTRTSNSENCTLVQRTLNTETNTIKRKHEIIKAPSRPLQVKVPLRPSALDLLRMPQLPLRSATFDEAEEQKLRQSSKTDEHTHILAINELTSIIKSNSINDNSNNRSKGFSSAEKTALGNCEVISVLESDDEVNNNTTWMNATKNITLTSNKQTKTSDVHETELESIDEFSSTWDECESMCESNDSISVCSNESSHNSDTDEVASMNNEKEWTTNNTQTSQTIRREISNTCKNSESDVRGQEVIEYDGWVYPADVFAAMQEAEQSDNAVLQSELTKTTQNATRQACAGLEIIGCQKGNELTHVHTNREMSKVLIQPAPPCTVPVLVDEDLYTNHDVFDCLDSRELAGMFETGDELGGVRYSAL